MRRVAGLALMAAALSGCGSSAASHTPIEFGITGGNIAPFHVTIQPNGSVRVSGSSLTSRREIPPSRVQELRREIQQAHLTSRRCPGALPDVASLYISVGGQTVTVHGACAPGFARVWHDLQHSVGLLRTG